MYMQRRRLDAAARYLPTTASTTLTLNSSLSSSPNLSANLLSRSTNSNLHNYSDNSASSSSPTEKTSNLNMAVMPSIKRVVPVDFPIREALVKRPHDKGFVPIEDIPSTHEQSATTTLSKVSHQDANEVLYPHFMKKTAAIASTLEYMTIKEKHGTTPTCFHGIWDGLKSLFESEKEFASSFEEENDQPLLFWHRGQKVTTTVPRSDTDYVVATFGNTIFKNPREKKDKEDFTVRDRGTPTS